MSLWTVAVKSGRYILRGPFHGYIGPSEIGLLEGTPLLSGGQAPQAPRNSSTGQWVTRPRRRRREAFTTDAKIIRLTRLRVAFFPTAAARHFFDGDYDATYLKNFPDGGYLHPHLHDDLRVRPCTLLGKGREEPRPGSTQAKWDCYATMSLLTIWLTCSHVHWFYGRVLIFYVAFAFCNVHELTKWTLD